MQRHYDETTKTAIITFTDCKHWTKLYEELQAACKLPEAKRTKYGWRAEKKCNREQYREMCRIWSKVITEFHNNLS